MIQVILSCHTVFKYLCMQSLYYTYIVSHFKELVYHHINLILIKDFVLDIENYNQKAIYIYCFSFTVEKYHLIKVVMHMVFFHQSFC